MLPRVAGDAPPPREPSRTGGRFISFWVFPSRPPWKILVRAHPPFQPLPPPHCRICALALLDEKEEEKEPPLQKAGWGGRTFWAGGLCWEAPKESRGEGAVSLSPLPGAAGTALDGRAWLGERAGRAWEHPAHPLPGRHKSCAPPPPPADSSPSHGDQSE